MDTLHNPINNYKSIIFLIVAMRVQVTLQGIAVTDLSKNRYFGIIECIFSVTIVFF